MPNTYTLISSVTVGAGGASSIDFTSIPATYTDLLVRFSLRTAQATVDAQVRMNVNGTGVGSNFSLRGLQGSGAAASSSSSTTGWITGGTMPGTSATANTFGNMDLYIPNYAGSNYKSMSLDAVGENNATTAYSELNAILYSSTSAISSLAFTCAGGNTFSQYSTAYLYGIKNS